MIETAEYARDLIRADDIARMAGVRPAAVGNWLVRHGDTFPRAWYDVPRSRLWRRADVDTWLADRRAGELERVERMHRHADELRRRAESLERRLAAGR